MGWGASRAHLTTGMQLSSAAGIAAPGSEIAGTTTSEHGGRSSAPSAQNSAEVPEFTPSANPPPIISQKSAS